MSAIWAPPFFKSKFIIDPPGQSPKGYYRDLIRAAEAAFTLIPQARPISFFVNPCSTGIPDDWQASRRGWEILSSQSEAINTHAASCFSIARSVSFIPTTNVPDFNSSSVIHSHLLYSTLNPRNIGIIPSLDAYVKLFYRLFSPCLCITFLPRFLAYHSPGNHLFMTAFSTSGKRQNGKRKPETPCPSL